MDNITASKQMQEAKIKQLEQLQKEILEDLREKKAFSSIRMPRQAH